jgi:hypothetical protein
MSWAASPKARALSLASGCRAASMKGRAMSQARRRSVSMSVRIAVIDSLRRQG